MNVKRDSTCNKARTVCLTAEEAEAVTDAISYHEQTIGCNFEGGQNDPLMSAYDKIMELCDREEVPSRA